MKFAMQDPRLTKMLPDSRVIAYFFHLRGKNIAQKSFKGMLTEILFRLIQDEPRLFNRVISFYRSLVHAQRTGTPDWDNDSLENAILKALRPSERHVLPNYAFFIDALDENVESSEIRNILAFVKRLEKLGSTYRMIKICLASRPWPIFQKEFASNPRIAIHEFTAKDIESYAASHILEATPAGEVDTRFQQSLYQLSRKVSSKAHGVFVWVRLVVDELCRKIGDGTTAAMLEDVLSKLPEELHELYEYTMRRIPTDYALEALVASRILSASLTPLNLKCLYCATHACISGTFDQTPGSYRQAWLKSRTGGLIEEVGVEDSLTSEEDRPVQFIHQTAEEFVHKGIPGLSLKRHQEWVGQDGSVMIFRSVAVQHPPFASLEPLARQFFHHVRRIDFALDQREPDLSPASPREHLMGFLTYLKPAYIMNAVFASTFDASKVYTESEPWELSQNRRVDKSNEFESYFALEEADPYWALLHKVSDAGNSVFEVLGFPDLHWVSKILLVLQGVHNADWGVWGNGPRDWVLLSAAAVGDRCPAALKTDRALQVQRILSRLGNTHAQGRLQNRLQFRIEDLLACLLTAERAKMDERSQFRIFDLLLDKFAAFLDEEPKMTLQYNNNTWHPWGDKTIIAASGCEYQGPKEDFPVIEITIADFCARFKNRQWLDVVHKYFPPDYDRVWWYSMAAALATGSGEARARCRSRLKEDLTGDYAQSSGFIHNLTLFSSTAPVLGGLVLGSLGFPQLFKAVYPDRTLPRSSRLVEDLLL